MPIRRDLLWSMANHSKSLLEELLCGIPISLLTQSRINQIAIVINRSREIPPLSTDVDGGFINLPRDSCLTTSLSSQLICKQRGTSSFPISDRLMGEGPPTLQKQFGHITKAQFVTEPPKDHKEDDIRRIVEGIEGSASAFIQNELARPA